MSTYIKNVLAGIVKTQVTGQAALTPAMGQQSATVLMRQFSQAHERSVSPRVSVEQQESPIQKRTSSPISGQRNPRLNLNLKSNNQAMPYFQPQQDPTQSNYLIQNIFKPQAPSQHTSSNLKSYQLASGQNEDLSNQDYLELMDGLNKSNNKDKQRQLNQVACSPWDTETFKEEADYWDREVEADDDCEMQPMPGTHLSQEQGEDGNPLNSDFRVKYKTEMCKNFMTTQCEFGDKCSFAHGSHELQTRKDTHKNYKTKMCKRFQKEKYCPYGDRCQFIHQAAPSPSASVPQYNKSITIEKQQTRRKLKAVQVIKPIIKTQIASIITKAESDLAQQALTRLSLVDCNSPCSVDDEIPRRLSVFQNITQK